jgi:hypothetical protein
MKRALAWLAVIVACNQACRSQSLADDSSRKAVPAVTLQKPVRQRLHGVFSSEYKAAQTADKNWRLARGRSTRVSERRT